jgi:mannosyltransferase
MLSMLHDIRIRSWSIFAARSIVEFVLLSRKLWQQPSFMLATVFAVSLTIRLIQLAGKPFWMDEIVTHDRSMQPFLSVIMEALSFHHFPMYFLLIHCVELMNSTEFALRLPSAIFGSLACVATAAAALRIGGHRAGLAAGLLMSASPLQIMYSQEARANAMAVMFISGAFFGLVSIFAARPFASSDCHKLSGDQWWSYAWCTGLAANVLGIGEMWIGSALATIAIIWVGAGTERPRLIRFALIAHVAILFACLPTLLPMYVLVTEHGQLLLDGLSWIPRVSTKRFWEVVSSVYLFHVRSPFNFVDYTTCEVLLDIGLPLLAIFGGRVLWHRRSVFWAVIVSAFGMAIFAVLMSPLLSLWLERYLLWLACPFFVLCSVGFANLRPLLRRFVAIGLGSVSIYNLVIYYHAETKPRWDMAAAEISSHLVHSDVLLVPNSWEPRMLDEYFKRLNPSLQHMEWTHDVGVAEGDLISGGRIWAVFGRVGLYDRESEENFLARIRTLGDPAFRTPAGREILILLYDRAPPLRKCASVSPLHSDGRDPCESDGMTASKPT